MCFSVTEMAENMPLKEQQEISASAGKQKYKQKMF